MGTTDFVVVTRTPPLVEFFKITFQRVKLVTRCMTAQSRHYLLPEADTTVTRFIVKCL